MTTDVFESHRKFLLGVAYRMLGSIADAEDIVQTAYVRWTTAETTEVTDPRAYLARVVSRLCLDRMKSAAMKRERYVGTWLPEPVVEPADAVVADDLSVALLLTLERLSPLERAAFLLHDVFDMEYAEIAETLGRTEIACRQLAARGRQRVRQERPRFKPSPETAARIVDAFAAALGDGKLDALADLLAEDAVVYTDGGGKRVAALNPIDGREKVVRFLAGMTKKSVYGQLTHVERATINGLPGFVIGTAEGPETIAIAIEGDRIASIYVVRNPEKLRHLAGHHSPER